MSAQRAKGTAFETAVVEFLRANGFPHVERRANGGARDRGDIAGIPSVVVECKSASRIDLHTWVTEAEVERVNDGAQYGVVWAKRRGKGSAGDGYVVLNGHQFAALLRAAGHGTPLPKELAS